MELQENTEKNKIIAGTFGLCEDYAPHLHNVMDIKFKVSNEVTRQ